MAIAPKYPACVEALRSYASEAHLSQLNTYIEDRKASLAKPKRLFLPAGLALVFGVTALAALLTDISNSNTIKVATAMISVLLAYLAWSVDKLAKLKKGDIDRIVGRAVTNAQFDAMKAYMGDISGTQRDIVFVAAFVVFALSLLGIFVFTDPPASSS